MNGLTRKSQFLELLHNRTLKVKFAKTSQVLVAYYSFSPTFSFCKYGGATKAITKRLVYSQFPQLRATVPPHDATNWPPLVGLVGIMVGAWVCTSLHMRVQMKWAHGFKQSHTAMRQLLTWAASFLAVKWTLQLNKFNEINVLFTISESIYAATHKTHCQIWVSAQAPDITQCSQME
jgi:hypothetical protein